MKLGFEVPALQDEFGAVRLPDARLTKRLQSMVARLAAHPSTSLPRALPSVAELEAGYRLLRNGRVTPEATCAPHQERAWERAATSRLVLSVEDTTEIRLGGQKGRSGLGRLANGGHGFYLHGALLVGLDEVAIPLGVVGWESVIRADEVYREKSWAEQREMTTKEFDRWGRLAAKVAKEGLERGISVVHVGDRETDDYALISSNVEAERRFIYRLKWDRKIEAEDGRDDLKISDALGSISGVAVREVVISERQGRGNGRRKADNSRQRRRARLEFRALAVTVRPPDYLSKKYPSHRLNVVEVREVEPPDGVEPVSWVLLTTEPVGTEDEVLRVIDAYRARWLIEELWKGLKTGCAFEARQLESKKTLETALAMFLPMACHMLLLRTVARDAPETAAEAVLSADQAALLRLVARNPKNPWGLRPVEPFNAGAALKIVARMGGHLPQNGSPGWITLRRGLDELHRLELAAELFRTGSDQS
jgi:hypothetical protein